MLILNLILSLLTGLAFGTVYGLSLFRLSLGSKEKARILVPALISFIRFSLLAVIFYIIIKFTPFNFFSLSIGFLLAFNILAHRSIKKYS